MRNLVLIVSVCLLLVLPFQAQSQSTGIYSSDVFNWRFYLNNSPDLLAAGIVTEQGARTHWQQFGITECRRAHPTFHIAQYLDRYSDIKAAYGSNCGGALNHWLTFGRNEGRVGLFGNYYQGRATVGNGVISLGTSTRTAGAIDSIYFNGKEFVNSYDHGRQLQFAWSLNGQGECNNPTEAGSAANGISSTSSSVLRTHSETSNQLTTSSNPAFWYKTTDRTECSGVTQVPGQKLTKFVTVGVSGVSQNLIRFISQVYIPAASSRLVLEAPTGYLAPEFSTFYSFNITTCQLAQLSAEPSEGSKPVVAAVSGGGWAIGMWSPDLPSPSYPTIGYGRFSFINPANPAASTTKLNAVFRMNNLVAGTYEFESYVAVGSLETVRVALCQAVALLS